MKIDLIGKRIKTKKFSGVITGMETCYEDGKKKETGRYALKLDDVWHNMSVVYIWESDITEVVNEN